MVRVLRDEVIDPTYATRRANVLLNSTNSIDDILNGDDVDVPPDAWKSELHNRVEQIVDRKRSSTEGRAESLRAYAHILMARYANDEIEDRVNELLPSILRSIRQETTERETVSAIKGMDFERTDRHCMTDYTQHLPLRS